MTRQALLRIYIYIFFFYIRQVLNVIYYPSNPQFQEVLALFDAVKEFDYVVWNYIFEEMAARSLLA